MRAMRAEQFSGYEGLKLVELPKPAVTDGKVLVRITAAGVTRWTTQFSPANFTA
jgi:NADPH2:quinone reductase